MTRGFGLVLFLAMACTSASKKEPSGVIAPSPTPLSAGSPGVAPSVTPSASKRETSDGMEIGCTSGKDKRVLTVVPKGDGCELHYQKHGKSSVVGQAVKQQGFCEELRGRIRNKLEAAGFACGNL
ncbi:MAG: hypothetical protein NDJ89_11330 [Oligoflexia bacterium]|nr:hypothetical protein [Oligoflexia bacterium]